MARLSRKGLMTRVFLVAGSAATLLAWTSPATAQRAPGIASTLNCPAGTVVFDWDNRAWNAGATSASYQVEAIGTMEFAIGITGGGVFLNNSSVGGQSPARQTAVNGGFTGQSSLIQLVDLSTRTARVTTTITLPAIMRGAQFRLFDVDYTIFQYSDLVTVEGRYNGAAVVPALTNGVSNYVTNNTAIGDGAADSASANGNVVVTFTQPIDTIIISYGNHTTAPFNPGQQGIALHDITMCRPVTTITTSKSNTLLSDPQSGTNQPKYIPGATVEYCILVRNTGDTFAQSVVASDPLPATVSYSPGTLRSGTACATATTPEDDDAVGADENDPVGASFTGSTVTTKAESMTAGNGYAVRFNVVVR